MALPGNTAVVAGSSTLQRRRVVMDDETSSKQDAATDPRLCTLRESLTESKKSRTSSRTHTQCTEHNSRGRVRRDQTPRFSRTAQAAQAQSHSGLVELTELMHKESDRSASGTSSQKAPTVEITPSVPCTSCCHSFSILVLVAVREGVLRCVALCLLLHR